MLEKHAVARGFSACPDTSHHSLIQLEGNVGAVTDFTFFTVGLPKYRAPGASKLVGKGRGILPSLYSSWIKASDVLAQMMSSSIA